MDADVSVAGGELAEAGRRVTRVEQEPEAPLGGQALWSLGGLFMVNSPHQRRPRIKDSRDLACQDWPGTASFAACGGGALAAREVLGSAVMGSTPSKPAIRKFVGAE
jgi:hypothetical protein